MVQKSRTPPFSIRDFLLEGTVGITTAKYDRNGVVYHQGDLAVTVFFVLAGQVKLTVTSESGKDAVVAILGADDFFGERCADGETLRLSTATALTDCSVVQVNKAEFKRIIHAEPIFAEFFIGYLLARSGDIQADLVDQLFNSSEKRLARALLLLANYGKESEPEPVLAKISQETLAELVGTTRSRINFFMNKFRRLGLIDYNGKIEVHRSLLNLVLHEAPALRPEHE